jgi:hypothetical protein
VRAWTDSQTQTDRAARCEGGRQEEGGFTAAAQEMAGGSLNVCHRQCGRGEGGQWLAVEGGRYHVQGNYNVVRAGGLMSRLGVQTEVGGGHEASKQKSKQARWQT